MATVIEGGIKLDVSKSFLFASRFGEMLLGNDPLFLVEMLRTNDDFYHEHRDGITYCLYKRFEISEAEYNNPEVKRHFERIQDNFRNQISNAFRQQAIDEHKKLMEEITKRNAERHKPSELGTVDEIVKQTGLSKKQVRSMKAEGTLEAYMKEHGHV